MYRVVVKMNDNKIVGDPLPISIATQLASSLTWVFGENCEIFIADSDNLERDVIVKYTDTGKDIEERISNMSFPMFEVWECTNQDEDYFYGKYSNLRVAIKSAIELNNQWLDKPNKFIRIVYKSEWIAEMPKWYTNPTGYQINECMSYANNRIAAIDDYIAKQRHDIEQIKCSLFNPKVNG